MLGQLMPIEEFDLLGFAPLLKLLPRTRVFLHDEGFTRCVWLLVVFNKLFPIFLVLIDLAGWFGWCLLADLAREQSFDDFWYMCKLDFSTFLMIQVSVSNLIRVILRLSINFLALSRGKLQMIRLIDWHASQIPPSRGYLRSLVDQTPDAGVVNSRRPFATTPWQPGRIRA